MIKYRLVQFINPILKVLFRYGFERMAQFTDDYEIIYHPWQLKKLKR